MSVVAVVVDGKELWQTVAASFIAGIGVTFVFSLAVLGAAQFSEAQRDGKSFAAAAYAALAIFGLLATFAAVAAGILLIASG